MTSYLAFVLVLICVVLNQPWTTYSLPSWYTLRGDYQRSGVAWISSAGLTKLTKPPTSLKWSVQTTINSNNCSTCSDPYDASPIFYNDPSSPSLSFLVVAHSKRFGSASYLLARNPDDGSVLYNTTLQGWLDSDTTSGSFLEDGSVIVTHRSGVERISKDGKRIWIYLLSDELSPPTVTSGLVIVSQGLCGGVFALDVDTGKTKWSTPIPGQGFCSNPYLSLDGKTLWITTTTTFQYTAFWFSIDVETGHIQQRGQFPDIGNPEMGFERSNAISGQSDGTFFMSYDQGDISCWPYCKPNPQIFQINSNTGANLTTLHLPVDFGGPIVEIAFSTFNGILYISNEQGDLIAIDPSGDGKILWTAHCPCTGNCATQPNFFDEPYQTFFSPIIAATNDNNKGVIITGSGNQLCAIETSGMVLWHYTLPYYLFQQPAISPDGVIYASTLTLEHGSWFLAL